MPSDEMKVEMKDLTPKELPTWCPACGDFNILFALKSALVDLQVPRENVVLVSGIGCGSKMPHFVKTYGFEGLHGRTLPVATGAKLANKNLRVIVVAGDGDSYGIGGNHFIHSMRRNLDITMLVQNNSVYGLTKGQYSPTTPKGRKSPSSPHGSVDAPMNPLATAIVMGATYIARGYAYDPGLKKLIAGGISHKGFSIIDILQPCPTYNRINTIPWFKERLYRLDSHDTSNKEEAMKMALAVEDRIPYGLLYKDDKPSYEEEYRQSRTPVADQDITSVDISGMLKRFK